MAAVLAAFCVLGNGTVALGAPVSDEEQLTAGVGQILDSLPETEAVDKEEAEETGDSFQDQLVMTAVSDVLNVRSEPSEDAERVGYLYADCGGTILERRDGWTKSGPPPLSKPARRLSKESFTTSLS